MHSLRSLYNCRVLKREYLAGTPHSPAIMCSKGSQAERYWRWGQDHWLMPKVKSAALMVELKIAIKGHLYQKKKYLPNLELFT